jgi:DNA-binding NtrC family response regulator
LARKVNVRILAATQKDLASEAQHGRFRRDLLYRLRVARISVPALRNREDDIPLLAEAFLGDGGWISDAARPKLAAEALRCLLSYDWPGNVRELKAAIDYASIRCRGASIGITDLPPEIGGCASPPLAPSTRRFATDDERSRILSALEMTGGNRVQAAKLLGMSRATFYRRLAKYGVSEDQRS